MTARSTTRSRELADSGIIDFATPHGHQDRRGSCRRLHHPCRYRGQVGGRRRADRDLASVAMIGFGSRGFAQQVVPDRGGVSLNR